MQLGKILLLEKIFKSKFQTELDDALKFQKLTSRWWSFMDMITSIFMLISRFFVIGMGVFLITR